MDAGGMEIEVEQHSAAIPDLCKAPWHSCWKCQCNPEVESPPKEEPVVEQDPGKTPPSMAIPNTKIKHNRQYKKVDMQLCHSVTIEVCNEVPKDHCVDEPQEKCVDVPRENCKDRQIALLEQDLKVQSPE